jgi:hypothetical protein
MQYGHCGSNVMAWIIKYIPDDDPKVRHVMVFGGAGHSHTQKQKIVSK